MHAVEVVVGEVLREVALEPGEAHVQVAGEGRAPALVKDRLVQRFDRAIRLRTAGADEGVAGLKLFERLPEVLRAILAAVVGP